MNELNQEQLRAVKLQEGAALVLAGAGSGKTKVVTHRIVELINRGVSPYQILGLTFTNKAAEEMQERVRMQTSHRVLISTFHSLGARILRESIHLLGYRRDFSIYDEEDSMKVLKDVLSEIGVEGKKELVKGTREWISDLKNRLESPGDFAESLHPHVVQKQAGAIYRAYQDRLKGCNAVDFDDLLYLPVKLFMEHEEALSAYQTRWPYLLVDEYQDTNHAQYTFIKLLAGSSQNLFVVGDPDQSIYSWRGASIRNILQFEKDFPGATIIKLEQNYRSRSNILEAANALIEHNVSRYKKNLWSDRGEGEKITLFSAENDRQEVDFVVRKIHSHRSKGVSYDEMAVFYRTNAQSRAFEDYLLQWGVPYTIVGGISFYQRMEIKDILAFLRITYSSSDQVAFSRTVNLPKRGMGNTAIEKIVAGANEKGVPVVDFCQEIVENGALKLSKKQKEGMESYLKIIHSLRSIKELSLLVKSAIQDTGYLDHLRLDPETFNERKENLNELLTKAIEWEEAHPEGTLGDFLSELTLKSDIDETIGRPSSVKLMTLHNGKGLEFEIVFLVGMEEDLFPHINTKDDPDQVEEERRLCYVGMTRAKEKLYLSHARFRYLWGSLRYSNPSRFLKEIPHDYFS